MANYYRKFPNVNFFITFHTFFAEKNYRVKKKCEDEEIGVFDLFLRYYILKLNLNLKHKMKNLTESFNLPNQYPIIFSLLELFQSVGAIFTILNFGLSYFNRKKEKFMQKKLKKATSNNSNVNKSFEDEHDKEQSVKKRSELEQMESRYSFKSKNGKSAVCQVCQKKMKDENQDKKIRKIPANL